MNKEFHQLAPLLALAQMPEAFRDFMLSDGYTEEQLKIDADLPDEVDKDNITQNSEIHHAHSFKLREIVDAKGNKYLDWLDGDCLQRLKSLAADAHDFKAEGKLDMVRYALAKATHYKIDSITFPHLHKGKPWSEYHTKFEDHMGKFIVEHATEIGLLNFSPYENIYQDSRRLSERAWYEGVEVVNLYEANKPIPDETALMVCRDCVKAIGDFWLTLAIELKIVQKV